MTILPGCRNILSGIFRKKRSKPTVKPLARLTCGHCQTANVVGECKRCGKSYVITTAHIEGRVRDADAGSVGHRQAILHTGKCDVCRAPYDGNVAEAEQQQRTCPVCHAEFLSEHER